MRLAKFHRDRDPNNLRSAPPNSIRLPPTHLGMKLAELGITYEEAGLAVGVSRSMILRIAWGAKHSREKERLLWELIKNREIQNKNAETESEKP